MVIPWENLFKQSTTFFTYNRLKKGADFMNIIYAYRKADNKQIVYVGQTSDLYSRHKQHIDYDPFNPNNKEYDYPLSRGVRKYKFIYIYD